MQENHENQDRGAAGSFLKEKGYYIVLFLCIAAIGISGYIFLSSAISESKATAPSMSVATTAEAPARRSVAKIAEEQDAAEAKQEPAAPTVSITDADVRQTAEQSVRIWPVSGSAQANYSMEKLAYNVTTRDWRTHNGLDIGAVLGEPVKAAAAGVVSAVYEDDFLGTTVVVSHDGGYQSQYSNLSEMPTVAVGTRVNAGDVLGSVGQSALLEVGQDAHLHFAVLQNGTPIDPMQFLD